MRRLRLWGPAFAWMAVMYAGSTTPSPPVPPALSDSVLHLSAYALMAALLARAVTGGLPARITVRTAAIAVAIAVSYGAALEVQQAFLAARTAELRDAYFNAAGACLGTAGCWLWGIIAARPAPRILRPGRSP